MRTKLAKRARELTRRIYASLPWGYRISQLLIEASRYDPKAFGLAMYALFVQAGTQDMPPIKGKPAESFRDHDLGKMIRAIKAVDPTYGVEFGLYCWKTLLQKYKNLELVENIMQEFMVEVIAGRKRIKAEHNLKAARTWTMTGLKYVAGDLLRKEKPTESMTGEDDEGEMVDIDLSDPGSWEDMEQVLDKQDILRAMRELDKMNPKLPSYMRMRWEGHSDKEIAEDWEVSPAAVKQFKDRWLPRAVPVIDKYRSDHA